MLTIKSIQSIVENSLPYSKKELTLKETYLFTLLTNIKNILELSKKASNYNKPNYLEDIDSSENYVAIWFPSDSENPDSAHMRFYGKEVNDPFLKGELPGERFGCQCSIFYKKIS